MIHDLGARCTDKLLIGNWLGLEAMAHASPPLSLRDGETQNSGGGKSGNVLNYRRFLNTPGFQHGLSRL